MATTPLKIYGIKTCDTVRKARRWLESQEVTHEFMDLRADGTLTSTCLTHWLSKVSASDLVNKRSTTWKQLDASQRDEIAGWLINEAYQAQLIAFLQEHPTLIKRPVFEKEGDVWIGFKEEQLAART